MTTPGVASLASRRRTATQFDIAHAALRLFAKKGLASTTVEEIAEEAGVGTRTFYRYYSRKQDAVVPLLTRGASEWHATLRAISSDTILRPAVAEAIAGRLRAGDERGQAYLELTRELMRAIAADRDLQRVWFDVNGESEEQLVPLFEALTGASDPLAPRLLAAAATDAIRIGLETWASSDSPDTPSPDVIARDCFWRLTAWYAQESFAGRDHAARPV